MAVLAVRVHAAVMRCFAFNGKCELSDEVDSGTGISSEGSHDATSQLTNYDSSCVHSPFESQADQTTLESIAKSIGHDTSDEMTQQKKPKHLSLNISNLDSCESILSPQIASSKQDFTVSCFMSRFRAVRPSVSLESKSDYCLSSRPYLHIVPLIHDPPHFISKEFSFSPKSAHSSLSHSFTPKSQRSSRIHRTRSWSERDSRYCQDVCLSLETELDNTPGQFVIHLPVLPKDQVQVVLHFIDGEQTCQMQSAHEELKGHILLEKASSLWSKLQPLQGSQLHTQTKNTTSSRAHTHNEGLQTMLIMLMQFRFYVLTIVLSFFLSFAYLIRRN